MNRPKKRTKHRKRQKPQPAAPTFREKLRIWGWIAACGLVMIALVHFTSIYQQGVKVDELLNRWRREYHLTDEQAQRIRDIELEFHGSGSPFTSPVHTSEETRDHHRAIAAKMTPEDGERFFRAKEGSAHHK